MCDGSSETHHTRLRDRVGYEDQEDAEHSSNLDGEAAWLALKPKARNSVNCSIHLNGISNATLATGRDGMSAFCWAELIKCRSVGGSLEKHVMILLRSLI